MKRLLYLKLLQEENVARTKKERTKSWLNVRFSSTIRLANAIGPGQEMSRPLLQRLRFHLNVFST